jgi:radical SAM-linked protein
MLSSERALDAGSARYRVRLSRTGGASALTHLAQIEALRSAVVCSGLPFVPDGRKKRPRPRISFGPAISVGYESHAEYFDLELSAGLPTEDIARSLSKTLREGFAIRGLRRIPAFFPSLDASINVVRYEICGPFPTDSQGALERLLARVEIPIDKVKDGGARIERVDARPLIREAVFEAPDRLGMTLRFGPKRTVKPEALLRELLGAGVLVERFRIVRKELLSETSGGELMMP